MKSIEYVGFVAGSMGLCMFIPEIIKTYKTKTVGITYCSIAISFISTILWIIYHYYKDNISGLVTTVMYMIIITVHLLQKIFYQCHKKNNNISGHIQFTDV